MAIPDKEAFESYEQDFSWVIKDSWLDLLAKPEKPITRSNVIALLEDWHVQFKEYFDRHYKHKLVLSFEENPSWVRGINSLYGKKTTKITKEQWMESKLNELLRNDNKEAEINFVIRKRIENFLKRDVSERHKLIFHSFYDYFYTDKWQKIVDEIADAERVLTKALLSVAPLKEFEGLREFIFYPKRAAIQFESSLNKALLEHRSYSYPIIRNDNTVKERGLVWDLAAVFRRYYGTDKPMAIYHLMMLEGIENNLELRTIERLLSKWKADRVSRYEDRKRNRITDS